MTGVGSGSGSGTSEVRITCSFVMPMSSIFFLMGLVSSRFEANVTSACVAVNKAAWPCNS